MVREYLICEAMHAIGIATTRALAVVATGERVPREPMATRRGPYPRRRVAPARRQLHSTPGTSRTGQRCAPGRLRDRPPPPRGGARPKALPRAAAGGHRCAGATGRAVDGGRVRARGHEHRQRHDLRGDHRLRPVRLHRRLRPQRGLLLHRLDRPLRVQQPAAGDAVEPDSPRRGPDAVDRRGEEAAVEAAKADLELFARPSS